MSGCTDMDSAVNIKGLLRSPLCKFGTNNCNIRIVKDVHGLSHMYVSVPQTIGVQKAIYTYDMRSIIESIQELNRRTATFNCDVAFVTANPNHVLPSKTNNS
jgi:hypothetical protein